MSVVLVGCVFALVWWVTPATSSRPRQRLNSPLGSKRDDGAALRRPWVEVSALRTVVCAGAGAALSWAVAGWAMALVGTVGGVVLSWWLGRLESPSEVKAREEIRRDLPLVVDLLGACALAGRPVDQALELVSRAVGGTVADRLYPTIARLGLGAAPDREWRLLAADPELARLARAMTRSVESGAPLVEGLSKLADDCRRERRTETQRRARTVGVKAAGPLAACFLPAFMLIGVVPTVAGAFSNLVL